MALAPARNNETQRVSLAWEQLPFGFPCSYIKSHNSGYPPLQVAWSCGFVTSEIITTGLFISVSLCHFLSVQNVGIAALNPSCYGTYC